MEAKQLGCNQQSLSIEFGKPWEGERKRVLLVVIEGSVRGTMEEERGERRQLLV